jgi:hypothetical protein
MTQRYAHLRDEALKRASDTAGNLFDQFSSENSDKKVFNLKNRNK